jgi:hypothetical protein
MNAPIGSPLPNPDKPEPKKRCIIATESAEKGKKRGHAKRTCPRKKMKGKKSIDDSSAPVKANLSPLYRPAPFLI